MTTNYSLLAKFNLTFQKKQTRSYDYKSSSITCKPNQQACESKALYLEAAILYRRGSGSSKMVFSTSYADKVLSGLSNPQSPERAKYEKEGCSPSTLTRTSVTAHTSALTPVTAITATATHTSISVLPLPSLPPPPLQPPPKHLSQFCHRHPDLRLTPATAITATATQTSVSPLSPPDTPVLIAPVIIASFTLMGITTSFT
jgi:hypothetical protein